VVQSQKVCARLRHVQGSNAVGTVKPAFGWSEKRRVVAHFSDRLPFTSLPKHMTCGRLQLINLSIRLTQVSSRRPTQSHNVLRQRRKVSDLTPQQDLD